MRILYLSVHRDETGYANAAINNILALEKAGFDVVCKPVSLTPKKPRDSLVSHLENKSLQGINVVMQHILPQYFTYKGGVKNIGIFDWETSNFVRSNWPECCNLMDEIWVPCEHNKKSCHNSKVKVPVKVWPHSCDINKFNTDLEPLDLGIKDRCIFYTIAEASRRKNFASLIRAYFHAFSRRDDVFLLIKTHKSGEKPEQTKTNILEMVNQIKKDIHVYGQIDHYPKIGIITDFLDDEKINRLHKAGSVFVLPSKGEAWAIPAHDAMGFGNPVIVSDHGGFLQFVDPTCSWLVSGKESPCFGQEGFPLLYTGKENFFDVDVVDLSNAMVEAYNLWQTDRLVSIGKEAKRASLLYSHEAMGKRAKELLNAINI